MINLDLYRIFYSVAKCGSLTKAADELLISQPAVSQAIKQLESQLGGRLFNRVSRGMELTDSGGKQMFEIVSEIFQKLDKAQNQFAGFNKNDSGTVRITASDNITTHFLMKYIVQYHEQYPNVVFSFSNSNSKQSIENIKNNKADIGLVNLPINDSGVLFTGQTGVIHDIFVASDKFSNMFNNTYELKQMANYPLIMLDSSTTTRQCIDEFTNSLNITLLPEFEVSSVELMVSMAKRGLGIGILPKEYVRKELTNGDLTEIKVLQPFPVREVGVIVKKNTVFSMAVSEMLRYFTDYDN